MTRRGLLGGLIASPAVAYSELGIAQLEKPDHTWYDFELVISEDQTIVSDREMKVGDFKEIVVPAVEGRREQIRTTEARCVECV